MIRRSVFILVPLIAIYTGFVGAEKSYAQGKTRLGRNLELQIQNARFNLGPFRITPVFVLSNAGYDSDIYYGGPGEPVEDLTFTAGAALDVYLPLKKKIIFHIYESPQYVYYKETERERNLNNYFRGDVYLLFNRFVASGGIGRSEAKLRWTTETDIPIFRKENLVQGSLFWQPALRSSFNFSYQMTRHDYGESDLEVVDKLDRDETYFNFTAYRDVSSRTRLFLDAEYGFFDFANPSSMKDSQSYGGYGGLEFSPMGKIRGRVKIGYKYFDSIRPQRKDYRGIVGDSKASVRLMRAFVVRAFYKRDIEFSIFSDYTYYLENRYGGGVSLYMSRDIRLDYDYSQGSNNYPQELGIPKRHDELKVHAVGIYLRLRKDVAFGVIASRWVRDSNLDERDFDRYFVGFNLIYDF